MPDRPYFRCFACGIPLEPAIEDVGDDRTVPVCPGLHFQAHGNYGCTIFDPGPPSPESHLEIVVCDWCLLERSDRVRLYNKDGTAGPSAELLNRASGPGVKPSR